MPRARKKSKAEPTPSGEVLGSLPVSQIVEQANADDAVAAFEKQRAKEQAVTDPAQSEALAEHLAARRRKAEIEPERTMPEPETAAHHIGVVSNAQPSEILGKHTAAVRARQPRMQPPPAGYFNFASDRDAGIRVCKSHDHNSVGLQFSNDRTPTRPEKDFLERVHAVPDGTEFKYESIPQIWERKTPRGWKPGENALDAVRTMQDMARARNEGLAR